MNRQQREIILYLFFGGCAFIVSIGTYWVANVLWGINALVANILSWSLAVLFAFATNHKWVFQQDEESAQGGLTTLVHFVQGRVATLVVEEAILFVFITYLAFNSMAIKVFAQIVVIVLNYLISKFCVFR